MRLCTLFSKRSAPFLLAPLLATPIAAATWFVTAAAGVTPLEGQMAALAAFMLFAGGVTLYVRRCLARHASR